MSYKTNTQVWDETELVLGLKEKNEEAYRELVRQYQAKLFRIAYGITLDREESADIVQDVLLRVYQHIRTFKGDSKFYFWLRRITINMCLNWHRRWKRRFRWRHQPLEKGEGENVMELGTESYSPETLYREKELEKILQEGLKTIPEDARTVFILKEMEGLSYEDIAGILKINKGTVSSRIFYARQKLKRSISSMLDQGETE